MLLCLVAHFLGLAADLCQDPVAALFIYSPLFSSLFPEETHLGFFSFSEGSFCGCVL